MPTVPRTQSPGQIPWLLSSFGAMAVVLGGFGLNLFGFHLQWLGMMSLMLFLAGACCMVMASVFTLRHSRAAAEHVVAISLPLLPLIVVVGAFLYWMRNEFGIVFFWTEVYALALVFAACIGLATAVIFLSKTTVLNNVRRRCRLALVCAILAAVLWPVIRYPMVARAAAGHSGVPVFKRTQTFAFSELLNNIPDSVLADAVLSGLTSRKATTRVDVLVQCRKWPRLRRFLPGDMVEQLGFNDLDDRVRQEALLSLIPALPREQQVDALRRVQARSQTLFDDLVTKFSFDLALYCSGEEFRDLLQRTNKQAAMLRGAEMAQRVDLLLYITLGAPKEERHTLFEVALMMNRTVSNDTDLYTMDRLALLVLSHPDPLMRAQAFDIWTTVPWKNHGRPKFLELTPSQKTIYVVALCDKDLGVVRRALSHLAENISDPESLRLSAEAVSDDGQVTTASQRIREIWPRRELLLRSFYSEEF